MKNSNDTIGNRTRNLPACSAVPQRTAPPRAPPYWGPIHIWRQRTQFIHPGNLTPGICEPLH